MTSLFLDSVISKASHRNLTNGFKVANELKS